MDGLLTLSMFRSTGRWLPPGLVVGLYDQRHKLTTGGSSGSSDDHERVVRPDGADVRDIGCVRSRLRVPVQATPTRHAERTEDRNPVRSSAP